MLKIFISHRMDGGRNEKVARCIEKHVRKDGYDVWIAEADMLVGDDIKPVIRNEVRDSDVLILVWSKQAVNSDYVKIELEVAIEEWKKIIPMHLDKIELPEVLSGKFAPRFRDHPSTYDNLLRSLRKYENMRDEEPLFPKFSEIKAGEFAFSESNETEFVETFEMADFPVTKLEFERFVGHKLGGSVEDKKIPATDVSWDQAVAYCRWLSNITGWKVSLPSEIQWEYAAKGGKNYEYATENGKVGVDLLNFGKMQDDVTERTVYRPNPFKIHDMSGNVWEWCRDGHNRFEGYQVVRGGSWLDMREACKTTSRLFFHHSLGNEITGFRLVRELS